MGKAGGGNGRCSIVQGEGCNIDVDVCVMESADFTHDISSCEHESGDREETCKFPCLVVTGFSLVVLYNFNGKLNE